MRQITIRFGSVLVAVGLIIGAVQIALRLMNGYWTYWRLSLFWEAVGGGQPDWPSYPGAEHAAIWILAWPLSVSVLAAGVKWPWYS